MTDSKQTPQTTRDEGYIKFQCHWSKSLHKESSEITQNLQDLIKYREVFYKLNLIGAYPDGIGFGNISKILSDGSMLISGSATGNYKEATEEHFSLVTECRVETNEVFCEGPVIASSESMTHQMIYQLDPEIKVVVHVHHDNLWKYYQEKIPTTGKEVPYGTPEMANEIIRLYKEDKLKDTKVLAMAGHEEGLIAFGKDFEETFKIYQELFKGLEEN